jgi:hypothetical protein
MLLRCASSEHAPAEANRPDRRELTQLVHDREAAALAPPRLHLGRGDLTQGTRTGYAPIPKPGAICYSRARVKLIDQGPRRLKETDRQNSSGPQVQAELENLASWLRLAAVESP